MPGAFFPPNCPVPDPLVEDDEEDVHMAEMEEDEEDETSSVGSSDDELSSSDEDGSDGDEEIDKNFDAMSLVEGLRNWASTNKATEKSVNMVRSVTGHGGYNGCQKCTVKGSYNKVARRMTFPGINAAKRTDQDFRNGIHPGHIKAATPLSDLHDFDLIKDMVVADRLHLLDLGIMKRMLVGWRSGSFGPIRLSKQQCGAISDALANIQLPSEIHRTVRGM
ncbi:hypothetical protein ZHAS_00001090 [Anopheles sinensis]|uniref:Uncharacterized protein n=1 Tax=Anopheles sinensis TaxID=74873 RepID=A0A084VB19_ANOSI|nr:hypothetical protein ZHAS_00001090 [Anopheles sinensis]